MSLSESTGSGTGALVAACVIAAYGLVAHGDESLPRSPDLGQPAPAALIEAWNIDIAPDGNGLPPGSGTVTQGEAVYDRHCGSCHGPTGIGASADELAGSDTPLDDEWADRTIGTYWPYATTLFDFIRRSMPMTAPGSLSDGETYAVTAYLLSINGVIPATKTMDAASLAAVVMPNRDGFVRCYPQPQPGNGRDLCLP